VRCHNLADYFVLKLTNYIINHMIQTHMHRPTANKKI